MQSRRKIHSRDGEAQRIMTEIRYFCVSSAILNSHKSHFFKLKIERWAMENNLAFMVQ
jgi:hypothetical protein